MDRHKGDRSRRKTYEDDVDDEPEPNYSTFMSMERASPNSTSNLGLV